MEPSLSDSQSFEVFHDSWAHHSRNASRGGNNASRGGNVSGIQIKKNGSILGDNGQGLVTSKNVLRERRFVNGVGHRKASLSY